jgi:hypothetical protein
VLDLAVVELSIQGKSSEPCRHAKCLRLGSFLAADSTRRPTMRLQRTSCRHLLVLASRSARGTKALNRGPLGARTKKRDFV